MTEARLLLDHLLQNTRDVFLRVGFDGTMRYVSPAGRDLYGVEPETLIGTPALDTVHPDDVEEAGARLGALAARGEGAEDRITLRIVRPGATAVWIDAAGRVAREPWGEELEIVALARESYDRVEAERKLQRVEERFRELVEWVPAVIYESEVGGDGRWTYVSPQIERLLGHTPAEWRDDPTLWRRSLHPDDRDRVLELERRGAEQGLELPERIATDYRMIGRDGESVSVRDEATIVDLGGERFWRGALLDVSARRAAEEAVSASSRMYRSMLEDLPACVFRASLEVGGGWEFASPQIEALLGYAPEEFLEDPTLWMSLLHPDDRDRVLDHDEGRAELPVGSRWVQEYRLVHRSGAVVWVRERVTLLGAEDGHLIMNGVLTDISSQRAVGDGEEEPPDLLRLSCTACGNVWSGERITSCPQCAAADVESVSFNTTLAELARVRRELDDLVDGIHRHLDHLRTLDEGLAQHGPSALSGATEDLERAISRGGDA